VHSSNESFEDVHEESYGISDDGGSSARYKAFELPHDSDPASRSSTVVLTEEEGAEGTRIEGGSASSTSHAPHQYVEIDLSHCRILLLAYTSSTFQWKKAAITK